MKLIRWPSIEQFRNVVRNVEHKASYIGMDENGDAMYNNLRPKPTLRFEGTVKAHGTNGSIAFGHDGTVWCQSRENIITPEKDNAGFAMFTTVIPIFDTFERIAAASAALFDDQEFDTTDKDLVIFGEWCGNSIQKGVALNQLRKMFIIFGIAFVDGDEQKTYLTREQTEKVLSEFVTKPTPEIDGSVPIYSIYDFPCYEVQIDFENPHEVVNMLNEITERVGDECPIGKALGARPENGPMTGEGVVWRCVTPGYEDSGFWMKVKDERHSKSKVKTLATVDVEKINNIKALAERLAHEGRLEQMCQQVFDTLNGGELDIKKMGEFIKAVMQDIFKEDVDVIAASGFTGKDINGPVSKIARDFLMQKLEV